MAYPEDLLEDAKNVLAASGKQDAPATAQKIVRCQPGSTIRIVVASSRSRMPHF